MIVVIGALGLASYCFLDINSASHPSSTSLINIGFAALYCVWFIGFFYLVCDTASLAFEGISLRMFYSMKVEFPYDTIHFPAQFIYNLFSYLVVLVLLHSRAIGLLTTASCPFLYLTVVLWAMFAINVAYFIYVIAREWFDIKELAGILVCQTCLNLTLTLVAVYLDDDSNYHNGIASFGYTLIPIYPGFVGIAGLVLARHAHTFGLWYAHLVRGEDVASLRCCQSWKFGNLFVLFFSLCAVFAGWFVIYNIVCLLVDSYGLKVTWDIGVGIVGREISGVSRFLILLGSIMLSVLVFFIELSCE